MTRFVSVADHDATLGHGRRSSPTAAGAWRRIADASVTEMPGAGWRSVIIDPTGAALGLWKSKAA